MKIGFICGSLETGKDGVGDYVRRLAVELTAMGHHIVIAAINDRYIDKHFETRQGTDHIQIPVLRIPSAYNPRIKFNILESWLGNFRPDLLSLQFVPFAFNARGLTFNLSKKLKKALPGIKWHIMFHELWVGMKKGETIKTKLWGWLQRQLIKYLIFNLDATCIHTQTQLYIAQLNKYGFNALHLPLFGNIPLTKQMAVDTYSTETKKISFVHFGTIYPGAPIREFAKEAARYGQENNKEILLTIIGRSGSETPYWINECEAAGLTVNNMGEQPVLKVSETFGFSNFGIATTACPLIEKSGSVAAMREIGLPVICVSANWVPAGQFHIKPIAEIFNYQIGALKKFIAQRHNPVYIINSSIVARLFINAVQSAK
jgi:hypothetical protein